MLPFRAVVMAAQPFGFPNANTMENRTTESTPLAQSLQPV